LTFEGDVLDMFSTCKFQTNPLFFQKMGILEKWSSVCVALSTPLAITLALSDA